MTIAMTMHIIFSSLLTEFVAFIYMFIGQLLKICGTVCTFLVGLHLK